MICGLLMTGWTLSIISGCNFKMEKSSNFLQKIIRFKLDRGSIFGLYTSYCMVRIFKYSFLLPGILLLFPERSFAQQTNPRQDRKSTRLNSSHVKISYAVFCLKKKKKQNREHSLL